MIFLVIALGIGALILLLMPFVKQKTGLETLSALEWFEAHGAILLCLTIFALRPDSITALIALIALGLRALPRQKPEQVFKTSLVLVALASLWLQFDDYFTHMLGRF